MFKRRYSGNDWHLWPFTLSLHKGAGLGVVLDSGARDDCAGSCHIKFHFFVLTLICELPRILRDYVTRHTARGWDEATIARLGRDWYEERHSRELGFTFHADALHTYFGPQTHSSRTTKSKVFFLPWRNHRHIRDSYFGLKGEHFFTEVNIPGQWNDWKARDAIKQAVPKVRFEIDDYDGKRIVATTMMEETEWHHGTGLFRWLHWIRGPKVRRSLKIDYSDEVGPEKGSWKGGTCGTGIDMLPGELHEEAFKRHCEKEHRSKYRRYSVKYVGRLEEPRQETAGDSCAVSES